MGWRLLSKLSSTSLCRRRPNFALIVRTVALSFKKFEYSEEADDPSILILHGLLGNKKHWEGIAKTISNMTKQSVMTVDIRNHGDSPHVSSHRYTDCAEDIAELLQRQAIEKAFLIGFSMGGRIAMSLALMKPHVVSGIIVVDISPVSTCKELVNDYPKLLDSMNKIDFTKLKQKNVPDARKYVKRQLRGKVPDDITLNAILANVNIRNGIIGWSCNLEVLIRHFKYIAAFPVSLLGKTYSGPTLFIGGQKSDFLPPDDLPRIRDLFPNSAVLYVPKTGHRVYNDDPNRFMELVINFVRKNMKNYIQPNQF